MQAGKEIPPVSGFVLAGGESRRMGTDKALLVMGGKTMLELAVEKVAAVAESCTVVGNPYRHAIPGVRVVADLIPGLWTTGGHLYCIENGRGRAGTDSGM